MATPAVRIVKTEKRLFSTFCRMQKIGHPGQIGTSDYSHGGGKRAYVLRFGTQISGDFIEKNEFR